VGKIGELRIVMYLEDLGPVELLMQKSDEIDKEIYQDEEKMRMPR
jgi:hypothetical protein